MRWYWSYLIHLPLVICLQAVVMTWAMPWPIKFLVVLSGTVVVVLASYHLLVRTTALGRFLSGRRLGASPGQSVTSVTCRSITSSASCRPGSKRTEAATAAAPVLLTRVADQVANSGGDARAVT